MKAAVLTEINHPLELANVELGKMQFGHVRVKMLASGICGAQLQEIRGEKGTHFPRLMGHEGCGVVEECGPGVTRVRPGQRVVCHWRKGEGIESDFPRYRFRRHSITAGLVTTFQEESIISENRLTGVPHDTPPELCALLGCGLSTALGTIENEAKLRFGESILVVGVGGLGSAVILASKLRGAGQIVATDRDNKGALALEMGASEFFAAPDMAEEKEWLYGKRKFDVIVDTAGDPATMERHLPMLDSGGRYVMVGQPKPKAAVILNNARHLFDGEGKTILATQGGCFNPTRDIPRYLGLYSAGKLDLKKLITHRIPLDRINEGLDFVRHGQAGRVLIDLT